MAAVRRRVRAARRGRARGSRRVASACRGGAGARRRFPLLLGSVVLTRFDLWPAALVAGALAALVADRATGSGFGAARCGGRGEALPGRARPARGRLRLAPPRPPRGARLPRRWPRRWSRSPFLPFLVVAPDGVAHSIGHQLSRPLQIESLGAALYLAAHHLVGLDVEMRLGPRLAEPARDWHRRGRASLARSQRSRSLVWIWLRRPGTDEELVRWSAAALVAFVALGKVLSPQFLIWLVPVVPLVAGVRGLRASVAARGRARPDAALVPVALLGSRARARPASVARSCSPATSCSSRCSSCSSGIVDAHRLDRRSAAGLVALDERALDPDAALGGLEADGHPRAHPAGSRARALTPITESCGPVMPTSVIAAVPPRWTRASEVCTCVCVPSTAVTRPSSQCASATFSLVASAWTSTTIDLALLARLLDELVDELEHRDRRLQEERAEHVDHGDGRPVAAAGAPSGPRPGAAAEKFAGRITRSELGEVGLDLGAPPGVVAERDHVGAGGEQPLGELRRDPDAVGRVLAVHDAEADAELLAQRRQPLLDRPPARARRRRRRRRGSSAESQISGVTSRGGADFERDVVARVLRVPGERLALDAGEVERRRRPSSGAPRPPSRLSAPGRAGGASARRRRTAPTAAGCRSGRRRSGSRGRSR